MPGRRRSVVTLLERLPSMATMKPTPHASFSSCGSYRPSFGGPVQGSRSGAAVCRGCCWSAMSGRSAAGMTRSVMVKAGAGDRGRCDGRSRSVLSGRRRTPRPGWATVGDGAGGGTVRRCCATVTGARPRNQHVRSAVNTAAGPAAAAAAVVARYRGRVDQSAAAAAVAETLKSTKIDSLCRETDWKGNARRRTKKRRATAGRSVIFSSIVAFRRDKYRAGVCRDRAPANER